MENKKYYYKRHKDDETPVSVKKASETDYVNEKNSIESENRRFNSLKKIEIKTNKEEQ